MHLLAVESARDVPEKSTAHTHTHTTDTPREHSRAPWSPGSWESRNQPRSMRGVCADWHQKTLRVEARLWAHTRSSTSYLSWAHQRLQRPQGLGANAAGHSNPLAQDALRRMRKHTPGQAHEAPGPPGAKKPSQNISQIKKSAKPLDRKFSHDSLSFRVAPLHAQGSCG